MAASDAQGALVETRDGRVRGVSEDGVFSFRGIPYAAPPVGPLRFRPPQPPEPWAGTRDAGGHGSPAPQVPSAIGAVFGTSADRHDEDCLTLNVVTPGLGTARRPVLVWLHGGSFTTGAGSLPIYDGRRLAQRGDAVVITLNYRLGILGWLPLRAFALEEGGTTGNFGLQDQITALHWVREHAERFGGDPDNVTIFGESAGAMSIGALLGAPAARGLFRRAILQSGAAHNVHDAEAGDLLSAWVTDELGVPRDDPGALRHVSLDALLGAQKKLLETYMPELRGLKFQPVVDGHVLPQAPLEAVAAGAAADVALVVGSNLDEYRLWSLTDPKAEHLDDDALLRRCRRNIPGEHPEEGAHAERVVATYRAAREGRASVAPSDLWYAIESDRLFRVPALRLLEAQAPHASVHSYLFTWTSPAFGGRLGSCHVVDVPFVFGGIDADPIRGLVGGDDPDAATLAARVQGAWLDFARGHDTWPRYDLERRSTLVFGRESRVEDAPLDAERAVWSSVV
jgi:para-nitrobenzyl esterase